jgi:hypothetical protein
MPAYFCRGELWGWRVEKSGEAPKKDRRCRLSYGEYLGDVIDLLEFVQLISSALSEYGGPQYDGSLLQLTTRLNHSSRMNDRASSEVGLAIPNSKYLFTMNDTKNNRRQRNRHKFGSPIFSFRLSACLISYFELQLYDQVATSNLNRVQKYVGFRLIH